MPNREFDELPRGDQRVGDADREQAAARLAAAYAEGRLEAGEHAQRLEAVLAAKTYRDLFSQVADLPATRRPGGGEGAGATGAGARVRRRMPIALKVLWTILATGVAVNAVVYTILLATLHRPLYPWPLWVAGPAGTALACVTLATRPYWPRRVTVIRRRR